VINQATIALACLFLAASVLAHPAEPGAVLDFIPPAPGTYQLQTIMEAPDGEVLDTAGEARALTDFTRDKLTLLGLIYTRCADPDGCPRATLAFSDVKRRLKAQRGLANQVRLVSLSFDSEHDTPDVLKRYGANARGGDQTIEWDFLTTTSPRQLMPILDGFGQDLRVASEPTTDAGEPAFTHTLKVFLIDRQGRVREIYTTAFLMPQMIVNDIKTLFMEEQQTTHGRSIRQATPRQKPRQ
jgi:protein SCO1